MSIRFRGSEDLALTADVDGPWGGPAVLLLHGGGQTRHAWRKAASALAAAGFLAVSVDQRGHGDSDWSPSADYRIDAYADDVREICRQVGRPVSLIGASLGGLCSILAAGEEPDIDCAALVLVDVTPRLSVEGRRNVLAFMGAHIGGFESVDAAAAAVSGYLKHRPKPADASGLRKNLREGSDGRLYWHWDPSFIGSRRIGVEDADADRLERALLGAQVPTLLVRGGISDLVSEEHVEHFRRVVPEAEYVNVPGAAHMVAGDSNDVFAASVVEFLTRRVGGRRGV
ncbi:alpha/beta hydrolase [Rhodococcus sp. ACS1]|uniref:alpha/beta fold hydrolase n=1 Tax=Rhodococcus sp. ACS1 TaxID=2028570 RepID=UPI000BB141AF|nr:alpha/beta hydrolase [Rhodococcus sp. ACS1]PBC35365.1 alpha/beta hydrolase [Rhodococcus sp. ACS1]